MRDEFSKHTIDILAKRVGIRCSNPGCRKLTTGPRIESNQIINIGVGAHITAAAPGGPRYNPNLSNEERKSSNNGIWLCQNCAKLVDNDPNRYPIEILESWKQIAERSALSEIEGAKESTEETQKNQVDLEISYLRSRMESERHDYILEIKVQNLGSEIIQLYHIDVEFPAMVVEKSKIASYLIENRSNHTTCFLRLIYDGIGDAIYPGDTKKVMTLPYYMDHDIYFNRGKLFEQFVKATFYRKAFQPLTLEKLFGELQFF